MGCMDRSLFAWKDTKSSLPEVVRNGSSPRWYSLTHDAKPNGNASHAGGEQGPLGGSSALVDCRNQLLAFGNCREWLGSHGTRAIRCSAPSLIAGYSTRGRRQPAPVAGAAPAPP